MATDIRARRIRFSYPEGSLERHYVAGDLVMSHIVSMLSAVFPEGEDFFVRSVKHYRDQVTDPVLSKQIAGFIGQEVTHGREHREINERLGAMGYPTMACDKHTKRALARMFRRLPHRLSLAITAALEHYTATLASLLLTEPRARALISSEQVRALLMWHAYEEVEHKAVAFDVYRYVGGTERMRIATMRVVHVVFVLNTIVWTMVSMARDRATYNPRRLFASLAALRANPWLGREVLDELRTYTRRGFHPDDNPTEYLLEEWRAELFGDSGVLADNLAAGRGHRTN
ncbi:metal-dependent hydrolase [Williamsia herbipolensis]|uniref:metal-dependent hydrolase n=1 Tax=Williamsia herbipolensis TaxID=1603258 RepID=UPI0005F831FF|nr:metal-dependent hydrolase [Williamsia herbipolensis]